MEQNSWRKETFSELPSGLRRYNALRPGINAAYSVLFAALGLGYETSFDFANANTGVSKFVFYAPGTGLWGADTHLIYHNDRSHLATAYPEDLLEKL